MGDYQHIAAVIHYLEGARSTQPKLDEVAEAIGLSPYYLQRVFSRWAGVSPKRFLQYLTVEEGKRLLDESRSVLGASLEVGLSRPGRLHDHFVTLESMTPGEYARGGKGLCLRYGIHGSLFGPMLLALTERGICRLSFYEEPNEEVAEEELRRCWPAAQLRRDAAVTAVVAGHISTLQSGGEAGEAIRLRIQGGNFQIQVWQALLRIPEGSVCTYGDIARLLGRAHAARAVGKAVSANPIAYLIPCHRVLRESGRLGGYRWGATRKRAMLAREAARHPSGFTTMVP